MALGGRHGHGRLRDFNCPYWYLASQRVDRLARGEAAGTVWRAVEHDQTLPVTGSMSLASCHRKTVMIILSPAASIGSRPEAGKVAREAELAAVAALALPGEEPPAARPR